MAKTALERAAPSAAGDDTAAAIDLGELSQLVGYAVKRAQLKLYEDFLACVASLQLTPAQFSVLLVLERNPGRNQTEVARALGILRPNFVAMLDGLEARGLCARIRSATDRRSHELSLTERGRVALLRARKIIDSRHEARLSGLLGPTDRATLLRILSKIVREF